MTHRSKRLRESAKAAPYCFGCGLENPNGDLLCLAHSNALEDGRGSYHKSDDDKAAILCGKCHGDVDGLTGWAKDRKRAYHRKAHLRTLAWWKREGYL